MVLLIFEASSPRGGYYRFGLGIFMPRMASMVTALARLF